MPFQKRSGCWKAWVSHTLYALQSSRDRLTQNGDELNEFRIGRWGCLVPDDHYKLCDVWELRVRVGQDRECRLILPAAHFPSQGGQKDISRGPVPDSAGLLTDREFNRGPCLASTDESILMCCLGHLEIQARVGIVQLSALSCAEGWSDSLRGMETRGCWGSPASS